MIVLKDLLKTLKNLEKIIISKGFSLPHHNKDTETKCPFTKECIKKVQSIYTMKYYSAIKKNKTMLFAAKYMDLDIMTVKQVL